MQGREDELPRRRLRPRRIPHDREAGQPLTREVPVGDAAATLLSQLQDEVRARIGEPAAALAHTTDVMVVECLRWLPVVQLTALARKPEKPTAGADTVAAVAVLSARCREQLEARWGASQPTVRAIDLLMRAVVVEVFNLWFRSPDARHAICQCVAAVRKPLQK
jgi:hypothetical protein